MKRIFCCLMAAVFVFLTASCGRRTAPQRGTESTQPDVQQQPTYTAFPGTLEKRESVFVSLRPDGSVQTVTVTDRLVTDVPQVQVRDVSILKDVKNLKSAETPVWDGVELTWHMQSTQLYYSGTTEKPLPVSLSVRYFLNGQPTTYASLRGKSGVVRVEITAENRTAGDAFVPFVLLGGTILGENASQITVENGSNVGDGSRDLVFGILLPGLNDALSLDAKTPLLPERFSFSYRTDSCDLQSLYFAMAPLSTARLGEALQSLLSRTQIPQMDFAPLLDGLRQLVGNRSLSSLLQQTADSAALFRAAQQALQGYSREQPLLDVLQRYLTEENAALLRETIDSLSGTTLQSYAELLKDPMFISLMADMTTVSGAFSRLIPTFSAMIRDLQAEDVRAAIAALPDTMEKLQALSASLQKNEQALNALSDFAQSGGLTQLGTLLQSVQSMLDSGALETLQALSGKADALEEKLQAVLRAGKEYGIFSSAPKDAVTSVYFIMKTQ